MEAAQALTLTWVRLVLLWALVAGKAVQRQLAPVVTRVGNRKNKNSVFKGEAEEGAVDIKIRDDVEQVGLESASRAHDGQRSEVASAGVPPAGHHLESPSGAGAPAGHHRSIAAVPPRPQGRAPVCCAQQPPQALLDMAKTVEH